MWSRTFVRLRHTIARVSTGRSLNLPTTIRFQLIWKIGKESEQFVKPLEGQTAVDLSVDTDLRSAGLIGSRRAVVVERDRFSVSVKDNHALLANPEAS